MAAEISTATNWTLPWPHQYSNKLPPVNMSILATSRLNGRILKHSKSLCTALVVVWESTNGVPKLIII